MKASASSSKRIRITDLRREAYATTRSVACLLKKSRAEGIPEHVSESTQHRARRAECARLTPYGPLVKELAIPPTTLGDTIAIQCPFSMLHEAIQEPPVAEIFTTAIAEYGKPTPERPWRLIWYQDEIGIAPLDSHDPRKTLGVYWSFVEFGRRLLCTDAAWFVAAAVRSSLIDEIEGGTTRICKMVLRVFFVGEEFSFRTGIMLHIPGRSEPLLLFAELALNAADLEGIFKFAMSKGATANVPCPLCMNMVSAKSMYALAGNALKPISCLNKDDVIFHTDESIVVLLKDLRDTARTQPGELATLETDSGFTHSEHNALLDEQLGIKFCSTVHLDWFHTYHGIFCYELAALMTFLAQNARCKVTYKEISSFVEDYQTAKALPKVSHLFHATCISKDTVHFKCGGSEALTLYPILAIYFRDVLPDGECSAQVKSFLAMCDVLDLLVVTREGMDMVSPEMLEASILSHMHLSQAAYGDLLWTLKFHVAAMHLARQYEMHGLLVSLFTCERRHKLLKRYIKDRPNTTSFERGLMEEVTLQHLFDLRTPWWKHGLRDLRQPGRILTRALREQFPAAETFQVSSVCSLSYCTARIGDVVALSIGDTAYIGELEKLARIFSNANVFEDVACVHFWTPVAGVGSRYYKVMRVIENPHFVPLECILAALTYSQMPNGIASCIVPAPLRALFDD